MKNKRFFYAICFVLLFVIETLIALYIRDSFVRPYLGDVLVVILVYCFVRIFINSPLRLLPLYVFIFAAGIEFMQYLKLADLPIIRQNAVARVVIGSVFDWQDILCYAIGCLALMRIKK